MASCGVILGKCSINWPRRRRAGSRRVIWMPDHVHMMIAIPPKYAVSQVVGYIKAKRLS
jgi:putative transposase